MKKLISLSFEEFSLIHYGLCLLISHTCENPDGFSNESILDRLDKCDCLLKKLSNTFNPERKPNFD